MARRRAWGSIVFKDGKSYAKIRVGGRRTHRLLYLEDGETACPADADLAEPAMERLRASLRDEEALARGVEARLGEWLDFEYAAILRSRAASEHVAAQHIQYLVRFAEWCEGQLGEGVFMHEVTRALVERFVADFIGGRMLPPIPRGRRRAAEPRPYKPGYLRRVVNVLRKAWHDAKERGYVDTNPFSKLELPRIKRTVVPWVEPSWLPQICDAVGDFQRPVVRCLAETGLRISEALALRREHLDAETCSLHVVDSKTDAGVRTVAIMQETAAWMVLLPKRADGLLFAPRSAEGVRTAIKRACQHLQLPPLGSHKLRHAYASHLISAGVPARDVAAQLGHSDGGKLVLELYGRWAPDSAGQRAAEALRRFRSSRGTDPASRGSGGRRRGPAGGSGPATSRP